jgi:V/A-type H+-transporting ATPase subunit I
MLLVLVPAHLLNLSLGLVAVFAHGVRLNLLEFSNHLGLTWGGREYQPFSVRP